MAYAGGKAGAGVFQRIISLMPPHEIYIEPFMGGFSIGRLKRPAILNIGIDRDRTAVEKACPPTHGETAEPAAALLTALPDPLARTIDASGSRWIFNEDDGIEFLHFVAAWRDRLFRLEGPVLIYCDPPYMRETCKSRCRYKYDLSDVDHRRLLRVLQDLNALPQPPMLMISGYDSPLYRETLTTLQMHLENGPISKADATQLPRPWCHTTFQAMTRGGKPATEHLWFNFAPPTVLHDSRYVGKNWRDRERMKRVRASWIRKLQRMKPYEREAMLSAIAETDVTKPPEHRRT